MSMKPEQDWRSRCRPKAWNNRFSSCRMIWTVPINSCRFLLQQLIRNLLGVKLDMTNYANLIDGHHVQNLLEEAQDQTEKFIAKEQENIKLRKKIDMLTEEGQSYFEELNKKEADILAAQVTLEQLKQRDQMLAAQNEMLKMDKINLKKKIAEMDEILKKNHGALNFQQSMKMKDNNLKSGDEELRKRLANVNGELALYAKPGSRDPHKRQEHWLRIKCQDPPEFES